MTNAEKLLTAKHQFRIFSDRWEKMRDILVGIHMINSDVPRPSYSADGHRLCYVVTDTRLFCQFTFANNTGVLLFGFIRVDARGVDEDVITSRMYFDVLGNVRETLAEVPALANMMRREEYDKFFFKGMLAAQNAAFTEIFRLAALAP